MTANEKKSDLGTKLMSDFVFYSKFSQYNDKGELETWNDVVDRIYTTHSLELRKQGKYTEEIERRLNDAKDLEKEKLFLSSQRARQYAFPNFDSGVLKHHMKIYNCSAVPIWHPKVFSEIMYVLLCGCGVGYSVTKYFIDMLPALPDTIEEVDTIVSVPDSIEGWADAVDVVVQGAFSGAIPKVDLGQIRPAGSLIDGKFIAPGPEPLRKSLEYVKEILVKAKGRKLTTIECYSLICRIAEAVLSGGIRRCLPKGSMVHTRYGMVPIEDVEVGTEVLTSQGYKKVLNNFEQGTQSLVRIYTQDSWFDCTPNHKMAVLTGIDTYEWKEAQYLEFGDRLIAPSEGIEGRELSLPEFNYVRPPRSTTCKDITIPEFTEEIAWFLGYIQGNGYVRLTSGKGGVSIAYPKNYIAVEEKLKRCFEAFGVNYSFNDYDNYKVIKAESKQLATYFQSWLKQPNVPLKVPYFMWEATSNIKYWYMQGIMDADGTVKNRPPYLLTTIYKDFAVELQILASSLGVQLRIKKCSMKGAKENWKDKWAVVFINNKSKAFFSKGIKVPEVKDTEKRTNSYPKEFLSFPYPSNYPWSNTEGKLIPVAVTEVVELEGEYETYDIEVEDNHEFFCNGYLTHNSACICLFDYNDTEMLNAKANPNWYNENPHYAYSNNSIHLIEGMHLSQQEYRNVFDYVRKYGEPGIVKSSHWWVLTNPCAEITLNTYDEQTKEYGFAFCNLVEVCGEKMKDKEQFFNTLKHSTFVATVQSIYTNFKYLSQASTNIAKRDCAIGVSITGLMVNKLFTDGKVLQEGAKYVGELNKKYAEMLGINPSPRWTTVKPSGTATILCEGIASGIHPPHDRYYLRRNRVNIDSPEWQALKDTPLAKYSELEGLGIISFPIEIPEGVPTKDEVSMVDHFKYIGKVKHYWINKGYDCLPNNVSCTIMVGQDEWNTAADIMYLNSHLYGGCSFLPKMVGIYPYLPFTSLNTKELWEEFFACKKYIEENDIDFRSIFNKRKKANAGDMVATACAGGACQI